MTATHHPGTLIVTGDVSAEADVLLRFDTAEREFGPVRALVNNAGVTGGFARVEDTSVRMLRQVLETNVIGQFLCGNGGAIVNVSISAALGGAGEWVHYGVSLNSECGKGCGLCVCA